MAVNRPVGPAPTMAVLGGNVALCVAAVMVVAAAVAVRRRQRGEAQRGEARRGRRWKACVMLVEREASRAAVRTEAVAVGLRRLRAMIDGSVCRARWCIERDG